MAATTKAGKPARVRGGCLLLLLGASGWWGMHARAQEEGGGADERAEDAAYGDAVEDYLYDHSLGEDDAAFQYGFEDDENHRDWQDNQYFQDWDDDVDFVDKYLYADYYGTAGQGNHVADEYVGADAYDPDLLYSDIYGYNDYTGDMGDLDDLDPIRTFGADVFGNENYYETDDDLVKQDLQLAFHNAYYEGDETDDGRSSFVSNEDAKLVSKHAQATATTVIGTVILFAATVLAVAWAAASIYRMYLLSPRAASVEKKSTVEILGTGPATPRKISGTSETSPLVAAYGYVSPEKTS